MPASFPAPERRDAWPAIADPVAERTPLRGHGLALPLRCRGLRHAGGCIPLRGSHPAHRRPADRGGLSPCRAATARTAPDPAAWCGRPRDCVPFGVTRPRSVSKAICWPRCCRSRCGSARRRRRRSCRSLLLVPAAIRFGGRGGGRQGSPEFHELAGRARTWARRRVRADGQCLRQASCSARGFH